MNNRKDPIWKMGKSLTQIEAFNHGLSPMNDRIQEIREALQHRRTSSIYEAIYRDNHESYITYLLSEVERLQRENEAMKEALEWYGDYEGNYDPEIIDKLGYLPIDIDGGERARTTLSHLKG